MLVLVSAHQLIGASAWPVYKAFRDKIRIWYLPASNVCYRLCFCFMFVGPVLFLLNRSFALRLVFEHPSQPSCLHTENHSWPGPVVFGHTNDPKQIKSSGRFNCMRVLPKKFQS